MPAGDSWFSLDWRLIPEQTTDRVFQFGAFEAREGAGELRKRGIRVKLHSQPFRVLVMLLEKPSEIVTRKQIQERLWGSDTFVDFDHGLNTAVNRIREALKDSAAAPRYVETVPGKGYRFIAPVAVSEPPALGEKELGQQTTSNERPPMPVLLTTPDELPVAPSRVVNRLLIGLQLMYLAFYIGALANLREIHDIFVDANLLRPSAMMALLVVTASVLIPIRLFLLTAVGFRFQHLPEKFKRLFPALLPLDLLWALSPFLLIHHISWGFALGLSIPLVYVPFAQRSLVLMYGRAGE